MNYDFSTLDSNDFEKLSRDLLNARFGWDLQSFKSGKDKGIDLRLSTPENKNAVVVQVKHYLKSGFHKLLKDLETNELPKIRKLRSAKYILVTSVSLNPQEKDEIVDSMSPYITSANDILGKEDLNQYLSELPDIETKWYKLWLTSVPVFTRILHNGLLGGSEFATSKILRNIQLYVYCPSYDKAFDILNSNKYILITGQPGVGKTTLAYYLTYHLLAKGFQLLYIDADISQASKVLSSDPSVKQVIFFDDFLGGNYLDYNNPKTTESAFVFFLERIIASENKYLILTTRTTIYNNALEKYEKLQRMWVSVGRKEIVLDDYSILDKAKILYKHIFFSDIDEEHKNEIFADKNYWEIICHRNYNPRLIEFVTQKKHLPFPLQKGYFQFIISNLNNPKEVWRYFYREQISVEERILLHVIFLQSYKAKTSDTKMMFSKMLDFEIKNYHFRPVLNPFQSSLKRLLDGTLKRELNMNIFNKTDRISFINPSLSDYLGFYFSQHEEERHKLLNGLSAVEQFEEYNEKFLTSNSHLDVKCSELVIFTNLLIDSVSKISCYEELKRQVDREKYIGIRVAALLNSFKSLDSETRKRVDDFRYKAVTQFSIDNISSESQSYYCSAIRKISLGSKMHNYVNENWNKIITALFLACDEENDFVQTRTLFEEFDQNYSDYITIDENAQILFELLTELADDQTNEIINERISGILSYDELDELKEEITQKRQDIFLGFRLNDDAYDEKYFFDGLDINDIIRRNKAWDSQPKEELKNRYPIVDYEEEISMIKEVEELYSGEYDETFVKHKASSLKPPY